MSRNNQFAIPIRYVPRRADVYQSENISNVSTTLSENSDIVFDGEIGIRNKNTYRNNILSEILNVKTEEDMIRFHDTYGFWVQFKSEDYVKYHTDSLMNNFATVQNIILVMSEAKKEEPDLAVITTAIRKLISSGEFLGDKIFNFSEIDKSAVERLTKTNTHTDNLVEIAEQICYACVEHYMPTLPTTPIDQTLAINLTDLLHATFFTLRTIDFERYELIKCKKPSCQRYLIRLKTDTTSLYCSVAHANSDAQAEFRKRQIIASKGY